MKIPYGYKKNDYGEIVIHEKQAETVKIIYQQYLRGASLGGIADFLLKSAIKSPNGREKWSRCVIDDILSNKKYSPHIIPIEQYLDSQFEKDKRSNKIEYTNKRKSARYNSQNVLSGLLICHECGANYRRITKPNGEIVWRCSNKVEHGKQICKNAPTISDFEIKSQIEIALNINRFDKTITREKIERIIVSVNNISIDITT
jgi:hypothetical protein